MDAPKATGIHVCDLNAPAARLQQAANSQQQDAVAMGNSQDGQALRRGPALTLKEPEALKSLLVPLQRALVLLSPYYQLY